MRRYYAAFYPHGTSTTTQWFDHEHRRCIGVVRTIVRFDSKRDRDDWVDRRPTDLCGNGGYREAMLAKDLTVDDRWDMVVLGPYGDRDFNRIAANSWRHAGYGWREAHVAYDRAAAAT